MAQWLGYTAHKCQAALVFCKNPNLMLSLSLPGFDPAQEFLDRFTKVAPSTMARPHFPSEHAADDVQKALKGKPAEEAAASGTTPDKLTFSFYLPHGPINSSSKVYLGQAAVCTCVILPLDIYKKGMSD